MSSLKICGCALALMTGTAANAADRQPADQPVDTAAAMVERMDRNLDGKISFEEYRNAMVRRFDARDRNGDGVLEGDEFPKEWLAGADVQGATGKVSWDQFVGELQLVFDRFDGNKDGQLECGRDCGLCRRPEGRRGVQVMSRSRICHRTFPRRPAAARCHRSPGLDHHLRIQGRRLSLLLGRYP